jgi:hypothetical protein
MYIEFKLDQSIFEEFLIYYKKEVNILKVYNYCIKELYERIKNGMNLDSSKKKLYYTFLTKIKLKL